MRRAIRGPCHCATLLFVLAFAATGGLAGQGCCSAAPQAGPGAVSGQGVGSLFPGQGWIQLSMVSLDSDKRFGVGKRERTYINGGRLDLESFVLTGAVGLVTGLELWLQGAVHSFEFDDAAGSSARTGLGDVRVWFRLGPTLVGINEADLPFWVGLRTGAKLPASEFPIDRSVVPLTEGQKDAEVALEVGRVFAEGRVAVQAWWGRRWRGRNEVADLRPGHEWFGYASVLAAVGPVQGRVAVQLLDSAPSETFGLALPTSPREMLGLVPSVGTRLGPGSVELGAQLPLTGRNLPAGAALTLAYTVGFGAPPPPSLEDLFPGRAP